MKFYQIVFSLFVLILLYGCASPPIRPVDISIPAHERETELSNVSNWKIKGKIAFITPDSRESANLNWQKSQDEQNLNVTTTLGISVFSIRSEQQIHSILVDGKKYEGTDLDHLLTRVTGYQLPVGALENWLKGVHFSNSDKFSYDEVTHLPKNLKTEYLGHKWLVEYKNYGMIDKHALAYSLKIKRDGLTILLKINQWEIL